MLKQLTLKNFVVIESLEVRFDTGLSTITGESGAGKSILLSALNLVLGARASADVVRPKSERADVIAEFDLGRLPGISQRLQDASH